MPRESDFAMHRRELGKTNAEEKTSCLKEEGAPGGIFNSPSLDFSFFSRKFFLEKI
jgi:hypothetical protein